MKQDALEILIVESYSESDRLSLSGGDGDPSQTNSFGLEWQPKTRHVLVVKDGVPAAHTGFLVHATTVEGRTIPVIGIGGVLTHPEHRGQGLGRIAMQAVEDFTRRQKLAQFALLFCRDQMRPWYESQGWLQLRDPVWIDQPGKVQQSPMPVMVKSLGAETWPAGEVQLGGLPW